MRLFEPKVAKNSQLKFFCDFCDYGCNKKADFNKHLLTRKHNSNRIRTAGSNLVRIWFGSGPGRFENRTKFEPLVLIWFEFGSRRAAARTTNEPKMNQAPGAPVASTWPQLGLFLASTWP